MGQSDKDWDEMESKRNKPKTNKFPESVLAFYIKVYFKQKGNTKTKYTNLLVEATKTWLSLTEEQKQQVCESYKEEERKYKLHCLDQLKNAEPFMKIKEPTGSKNVDLNSSNSVIQEPEVHNGEVRLQTKTEHTNEIVNDEDMNLSDDEEHNEPEYNQEEPSESVMEPVQNTDEETPRTFLVEPLPPTLKTSKDLFFMLNPAGGAESVSWTALTPFEKSQYRRAVCLLKTDYITKYREYLESLTSKELFDYYNKTLF